MPAICSVILLLVFSVTLITAEPIFFGGRRGRQRPIPTLPPLPSRFRLGSQRAAPRFTVHTQYINSPALQSFQNSIDTKEAPTKENDSNESDIIKLEDTSDITGDILLNDDDDFVTEADVEDSTATEEPVELRELLSEFEINENSLTNENSKQKSVTDTLSDFDKENIILDNIFTQNLTEQSLVTESFFKVIHENTISDNKIPNFVIPPEVFKHFAFDDNPNKESIGTELKLLDDAVTETVIGVVTETVTKHITQELTTTESVLLTFTNIETDSITITETEYSSVSYTPVFITVTDVVVETDCIKLNVPNTVTVYDTETVTTRLTEYIQYDQTNGPPVKTVTETRYSITTTTPSPISIVQTITDLFQVQTCTCVIGN